MGEKKSTTEADSHEPAAPDFKLLFESGPGLYLVLAPDLTIVGVSDAYLVATMTTREEVLGRGIFEVFPDNPDDPNATGVKNLKASLKRVIKNRKADAMAVQKYDIRRPKSEGGEFEERFWSPVNSPVFGRNHKLAYIIHRVEDVTDFVRLKTHDSEQAKRAEDLRLRGERMEAEVFLRAQQVQEMNRQLRQTNEQLIQLHADLEQRVVRRTAQLVQANEDLRAEVLERQRSEEAVREQREWFQVTLSSIGDGVIVCDASGLVAFMNPVAESLTGWPREEAVQKPLQQVFRIVDEETRQAVENPAQKVMKQGAIVGLANSTVLIAREGTERPIDDSAAPIRGGDSQILGVVLVFRDVTERRRAEQSRAQLAVIVESSEDAIFSGTLDGIVTSWNPGAERLTGYSAQEAIGKSIARMIPADRPGELEEINKRLLRGESTGPFEAVRVRKDGKRIEVSIIVSPVKNKKGKVIGASTIARDISQSKRLEEQFRQAQKMEAIGLLAGGVAHDFNNLLTIISGYSEIVMAKLAPADPVRDHVKSIRLAGERAAALTRQLLAFSRQTVLEPKVVDLNEVIRETEKMLHRLIGEDILLTAVLDPKISHVTVDPGQLGQVLMNLAVNARDAMPRGGRLTIETANRVLDQTYASARSELASGRYVVLSMTDTGSGMAQEVKTRIFEPFFTTKEVGKGTGLGLAVVHGIVKQSGGHIEVYSEPDLGTTIKLFLPAVDAKISIHDTVSSAYKLAGAETILLVEDQDDVRSVASIGLQSYGYIVLPASDGAAALQLARQHGKKIDLLLTDVVMPGMSGRELAETLHGYRPEIKVLYVSGYTDDAVVRHGLLQEQVSFLQKPYTPFALVRKVRQVLDGK